MEEAELCSWWFVHKEWNRLRRSPVPDKGFEDSFREYLYRKISFDRISYVRDTGLGLSYQTLSDVPHELDVICIKGRDLYIFELKHYEVSNVTKEILFTFLGKIIDFYFKNAGILSNYKITMFLVTINRNVDDSIRKLCIAYGIRLIEPSLMTLGTLDYFVGDLYQKTLEENSDAKFKVEEAIEKIGGLKERYDCSFSDIFSYKDGNIQVEPALLTTDPTETLSEIKECNNLFETLRQEWKSKRN